MPCSRCAAEDMQTFASLRRRGQLGRLRHLGHMALAAYGLDGARLTLLRHQNNTTFRVDAPGGPYVLRINRPQVHTVVTVESEMAWLGALRRDTDLGVPEPRGCVLLRWLDGRFSDRRLTPAQLRRVAVLEARLHEHAAHWTPHSG